MTDPPPPNMKEKRIFLMNLHVTCDMRHMTGDTQHMGTISKFQVPLTVWQRRCFKGKIAVCRTGPAELSV